MHVVAKQYNALDIQKLSVSQFLTKRLAFPLSSRVKVEKHDPDGSVDWSFTPF